MSGRARGARHSSALTVGSALLSQSRQCVTRQIGGSGLDSAALTISIDESAARCGRCALPWRWPALTSRHAGEERPCPRPARARCGHLVRLPWPASHVLCVPPPNSREAALVTNVHRLLVVVRKVTTLLAPGRLVGAQVKRVPVLMHCADAMACALELREVRQRHP